MNFLSLLVSPVANIVTTHLKNKAEEKQAVHQRKLNVIQNDASWEQQQASASASSWKDEWFVILLSIPLIGAFIPEARPFIEDGFICLDAMPVYYKGFLASAIAASFGIKSLANWKK
jgi:hypothetical protein